MKEREGASDPTINYASERERGAWQKMSQDSQQLLEKLIN